MEMCLASIEDLKNDSIENRYSFTDEFVSQILIHTIKAINSLLKNSTFHSDIKPSNIMLTTY